MQSQPSVQSSRAAHVTGPARVLNARPARTFAVDRWLLGHFLRLAGSPPIRCVLPDGAAVCAAAGEPIGSLRFKSRRALYRLLRAPELAFGEGYTDGSIEVEGSLVELLAAAYGQAVSPLVERLLFRAQRARPNSLSGSRNNIHHHYDLGNEFYRLWLDEHMVYTCAYFPDAGGDARRRADGEDGPRVPQGARCAPGERVVEAGCGWGALALHMARHYGVTVRAFNISREQIAYARERARAEGLDRVEFIEDDYRNVTGQYDAFVSVGMLEHVGRGPLPRPGRASSTAACRRIGRGLIHTIGRNRPHAVQCVDREAHLSRRLSADAARDDGHPRALRLFGARRREPPAALREDAAHWLERFERHADRRRAACSTSVRARVAPLPGGHPSPFRTSLLQLFQVTFARERCNTIPWTRAHVYAEET